MVTLVISSNTSSLILTLTPAFKFVEYFPGISFSILLISTLLHPHVFRSVSCKHITDFYGLYLFDNLCFLSEVLSLSAFLSTLNLCCLFDCFLGFLFHLLLKWMTCSPTSISIKPTLSLHAAFVQVFSIVSFLVVHNRIIIMLYHSFNRLITCLSFFYSLLSQLSQIFLRDHFISPLTTSFVCPSSLFENAFISPS